MQDLKKNLLRFHQREDLKHDLQTSEKMLDKAKPEDKGIILAGLNRTKKQLESQSPVPLTPKEKDTLFALEKKLRTKITQNMPPDEVMRKNPPGAVDWQTRWERANKSAVRMWKNITIQLNPDNADRDLTNIERFRPSGQMDRMRTDAQIPGLMTFGNVPDENWPFDPPQNTALAQVQRHYSELEAANDVDTKIDEITSAEKDYVVNEEEVEVKKELTPEQHAALLSRLEKGRAVLAAQRAAAKQVEEEVSEVQVSV